MASHYPSFILYNYMFEILTPLGFLTEYILKQVWGSFFSLCDYNLPGIWSLVFNIRLKYPKNHKQVYFC